VELFCEFSRIRVVFCSRRPYYIIKRLLPKGMNMNITYFTDMFVKAKEETIGVDPNSSTTIDDAYDTFIDLVSQLKSGDDYALAQMVRMSTMTLKEKLRWRMHLAEEGIEMTPRQVDEYIVLLELAINHSLDD